MPSTAIESATWDDGVLTVKFVGGDIYDYVGVPEEVFHHYLAAPSKGQFINTEVKPYFAALKHH